MAESRVLEAMKPSPSWKMPEGSMPEGSMLADMGSSRRGGVAVAGDTSVHLRRLSARCQGSELNIDQLELL